MITLVLWKKVMKFREAQVVTVVPSRLPSTFRCLMENPALSGKGTNEDLPRPPAWVRSQDSANFTPTLPFSIILTSHLLAALMRDGSCLF